MNHFGRSAVIFDLDGVLVDSEPLLNEAKEEVVRAAGGRWTANAPRAMMGMSSREWPTYIRDALGVRRSADEIMRDVIARIMLRYDVHVPMIPGAVDTVKCLDRFWPLALASSSNRELIDFVLEKIGLDRVFSAIVSSEEVAHGKPSPDVYCEANRRIGALPNHSVAVEDSSNGLRAAAAAGMLVVAVPNSHYAPDADALAMAKVTIGTIAELTPELIRGLLAN